MLASRLLLCVVCSLGCCGLAFGDEPPADAKRISVEIVIADVAGDASDANMTAERLTELEQGGKVAAITRIHVTAQEGAKASLQFGERAPVVTARAFSGRSDGGRGGLGQESISFESVGTLVQLTPERGENGAILIDFQVERSQLVPPPAAKPEQSAAESITATMPRHTTMQARSTLVVPSGEAVVAASQRTKTGGQTVATWILVSARYE